MFNSLFVINSLLRKIVLIICVFIIIGALVPVHASIIPGEVISIEQLSGQLVSHGRDANLLD